MPNHPAPRYRPDLLILGGSVRAAALSATRAGWNPVCVDRFADADLTQFAHDVFRVADPADMPVDDEVDGVVSHPVVSDYEAVLGRYPAVPVLITGSLENSPGLLHKIYDDHSGLLPDPAAINRCRDIAAWSLALANAGLPMLPIWTPAAAAGSVHGTVVTKSPDPDGRWIYKPKASAGGVGVYLWESANGEQSESRPVATGDDVWQEFVNGKIGSAIVLATRNRYSIVAVTEQSVGHPANPHHPFIYAGSTVPAIDSLASELRQTLNKQVALLCQFTGITGLVGVDFVVADRHADSGGIPIRGIWPIEINPRYTASMELAECWLQRSLLRWHQQAFRATTTDAENRLHDEIVQSVEFAEPGRHFAKRIVYAPWTGRTIDPHLPVAESGPMSSGQFSRQAVKWNPFDLPEFADIPHAGTTVHEGSPLCTVFATGSDRRQLEHRLREAESAAISRILPR